MDNVEIRAMASPVKDIEKPETREMIKKAGVIFGCDSSSESVSLFYGKEMLQDIARGRDSEFDEQTIIAFDLDFTTSELEYLFAAIETLRGEGSCCYNR